MVELDSRAHHDNPLAFETDRDRDADLLTAGFAVIRLTPERMTRAPEREAARLRTLLDRRSSTAGPGA